MAYQLFHSRKILSGLFEKGTWKGRARSQIVLLGNWRLVVRYRVFLLVSRVSFWSLRREIHVLIPANFASLVGGRLDRGFIGLSPAYSLRWHSLGFVSVRHCRFYVNL
jgi:hypothetical protein